MIKALRNDPATQAIPVIVLTGRGDDDTFAEARRLGASHFLTKPVEKDVLLRAIEAQLAPKTRAKAKKS
jgi:FixJ family two-component response regulator